MRGICPYTQKIDPRPGHGGTWGTMLVVQWEKAAAAAAQGRGMKGSPLDPVMVVILLPPVPVAHLNVP